MSDFSSLDDCAMPLVTVPDDEGSAIGAKFTVNPDAIRYLQSIRTKVRTGCTRRFRLRLPFLSAVSLRCRLQ